MGKDADIFKNQPGYTPPAFDDPSTAQTPPPPPPPSDETDVTPSGPGQGKPGDDPGSDPESTGEGSGSPGLSGGFSFGPYKTQGLNIRRRRPQGSPPVTSGPGNVDV